jgi:hypothetical protein
MAYNPMQDFLTCSLQLIENMGFSMPKMVRFCLDPSGHMKHGLVSEEPSVEKVVICVHLFTHKSYEFDMT